MNSNEKPSTGLIPQDFIQTIIEKSDITDYANQKLSLKKCATNRFKAVCPFHDEKTPSFYIHTDKQYYHCFGCGANGNIITFIMKMDHLTFPEAVELLAEKLQLTMPNRTQDNKKNIDFFNTSYQLLEQAAQFFHHHLSQSKIAIDYLNNRHLSTQTIETFKLGFSPAQLPQELITRQTTNIAKVLGLIHSNGNNMSYFKNRIIFPIKDTKGRTIGFGGRSTGNNQPKYLNSKESLVFHKSNILYGLYEARMSKPEYIIVVEGYMDVLMLSNYGIQNAIATLGTAITTNHIKLLLKYTKKIAFCFDGDIAGKKAAWKAFNQALPIITDGIEIKFIFLPDGYDPDSFLLKFGKAKLKDYFSKGLNLNQYFFSELKNLYPTNNLEKKALFGHQAILLIEKMANSLIKHLLILELEKILGMTIDKFHSSTPLPSKSKEIPLSTAKPNLELFHLKIALCLITQNPILATDLTIPNIIKKQEFLLCKVLLYVLELVVSFECKTTASLVEASRAGQYFDMVKSFAIYEYQTPAENMQEELSKLIHSTELLFIRTEIDSLLYSVKKGNNLDDLQKKHLQSLLDRKALLNQQIST